jgi:hypothetical protein
MTDRTWKRDTVQTHGGHHGCGQDHRLAALREVITDGWLVYASPGQAEAYLRPLRS